MKYYIFTWRAGALGGRKYILSDNKADALARLHEYIDSRTKSKPEIHLEQVMPA